MAKKGYDVTIYERAAQVGGLCSGWERKGYIFDLCMHWFCGVNAKSRYYKLWDELEIFSENESSEYEVIKKIEYEKDHYINFYSDLDLFKLELIRALPKDERIINGFIDDLRLISLNTFDNNLINYISPSEKMNLFVQNKNAIKALSKWGKINIYDFSQLFHDSEKAYNIFRALLYCGDFVNVGYIFSALSQLADGGIGLINGTSRALSKSMEKSCIKAGCKIKTNCCVNQILLKENRVNGIRINNSENIHTDIVVATCEFYSLFNELLNVDTSVIKMFNSKKIFCSIIQVSLGVRKHLNDVSRSIILDEKLKIDDCTFIDSIDVRILNSKYGVAEEGKSVVEITAYANYNAWNELYMQEKSKYLDLKNKVANELIEIVGKKLGISNEIELYDVVTPVTIKRYTQNREGSILGWDEDVDMSNIISKMPDNCYYIGQWSQRGMNMPLAATSGKLIANLIEERG